MDYKNTFVVKDWLLRGKSVVSEFIVVTVYCGGIYWVLSALFRSSTYEAAISSGAFIAFCICGVRVPYQESKSGLENEAMIIKRGGRRLHEAFKIYSCAAILLVLANFLCE